MNTLTIIAICAFSLVVLLLILNVFIAPIIRKKAADKKEAKMKSILSSLKKDDKILLASGIRALYVKQKNDVIFAKIAENVVIKVDSHAIIGVYK